MSRQSMNWRFVDGTLLIVHGLIAPLPTEWDEFIAEAMAAGPRMQQVLVFSDVGLSPLQRRQVADSVAKAGTRAVAVVCFSRLARTIVTGLGWMTHIHRAFAPTALGEAFEFLQSTPQQRSELLRAARQFAIDLSHAELAPYLEEPQQDRVRRVAR
ncbi:MAG: hypothetical protein ACRENE_32760 [Polyangiaceae bacterium]